MSDSATEILFSQDALNIICNAKNIYIAYSGGVDSHVLLDFCVNHLNLQHKLTAVYVDHGLQEIAKNWGEHCLQQAKLLKVKFQLLQVDAKAKQGESLEEVARNARYQVLKRLLNQDDVLLVAQHREDQLETFLLQLFRGAGVQGLAAMPEKTVFGKGLLLRPLLDTSQQTIQAYAKQHQLNWIEDPSNQEIHFDRNFLRNQVIPLLKTRWISVDKTVARSAKHCANANQLLSTLSEELFIQVWSPSDNTLLISKLNQLPTLKQNLVIRQWFASMNLKMPQTNVIKSIFKEVIETKTSATPVLHVQKRLIRSYQNKLYCLPQQHFSLDKKYNWPANSNLCQLTNNSSLQRISADTGISKKLWQTAKEISICPRSGGEKLLLDNRQGHHLLKKLFQEAHIPPWEREQIPLLYFDNHLVAVADLWIDAKFLGKEGEDCYQLLWCKN